jgi:negative regulator of sigma E activity
MSGSKNTPNGDSRKPAARGTLALAAVVCVLLVWGYVHYAKKGSRPEGPAPVDQETSAKGRAEPASIPVASATNAVSGLAAQLNDPTSAPKTRRQLASWPGTVPTTRSPL